MQRKATHGRSTVKTGDLSNGNADDRRRSAIPTEGYSVDAGETVPTLKANVTLPTGYSAENGRDHIFME